MHWVSQNDLKTIHRSSVILVAARPWIVLYHGLYTRYGFWLCWKKGLYIYNSFLSFSGDKIYIKSWYIRRTTPGGGEEFYSNSKIMKPLSNGMKGNVVLWALFSFDNKPSALMFQFVSALGSIFGELLFRIPPSSYYCSWFNFF